MAETSLFPQSAALIEAEPRTRAGLAGVLVMSFSSLLLELALTRLFSVILFYHFAFLAISIALLGLGAGGVFAYVRKEWLARWDTPTLGARIAALNAVMLLVVLEIDLHIPVALQLEGRNLLRLSAIYLVSALPFFFTGLFFSVLFARQTRGIAHLYAADLAGGALACLGIVPLLNFLGGPNAVLAGAVASATASAIWAPTRKARRLALLLVGLLAVLAAINYRGKLIDIVYAKGMRRDKPWVLFSRWNALSRVEVDDQGGAKVIVIDADASTYIMNTDPYDWRPDYRRNLMSAAPSIANILRPHGTYAIIGPGGGVDVLRALANGSPSVTGIEINPIIVNDIMRGRWADWAFHLYDRPEVHMHIGDGRSWVRNSREQFDVLQMTLVDTWASTAAGAFALSENNLYTVEAFREYFDHLKPDGIIAITRWEFKQPREALRVVSQELEILNRAGIKDLPDHFIIVSEGALDEDGRPVTVLFKKSRFTPEDKGAVVAHLAAHPDLHPLYLPPDHYVGPDARAGAAQHAKGSSNRQAPSPAGPDAAATFGQLISSGNPRLFSDDYPYNVSPVTDNAPFFFFTFKTTRLVDAIRHGSFSSIDWKVNLGIVVLAMLLVISVAAVVLFLLLPLAIHDRARRHGGFRLLYFVAIGLGYILAEIAFIQRFVLFLGHPTYALTVVIFLMLLASGAGSLVSRRWLPEPLHVWIPLLIVCTLLTVYVGILPGLLRSLVGVTFPLKLAISAAVLLPLGFAMGMPFPSGLRCLAAAPGADNSIEWAWAMNAAASVLGSVLAMLIAIQFGLGVTLACGAAAYVFALALVPRLRLVSAKSTC